VWAVHFTAGTQQVLALAKCLPKNERLSLQAWLKNKIKLSKSAFKILVTQERAPVSASLAKEQN
jgi:hypothetical protein